MKVKSLGASSKVAQRSVEGLFYDFYGGSQSRNCVSLCLFCGTKGKLCSYSLWMFLGSLGVVPIHLSPICGVSYSYVMSVSISFVLFELPTSSVRRWPDCCNSCWFHLQIEAKKDPEVKHLHRWTTPLNTTTWQLPMISMIVYDSLWSI
jgi:hypothetical protein